MKFAYTKTNDFPFETTVSQEADGLFIRWNTKQGSSFKVDEAFIRSHVGRRELTEASNIYVLVDGEGNFVGLRQKMAQTYLTKASGFEYAKQNNVLIAAQIYVPFGDSPFSEWSLRVNFREDQAVTLENAQEVAPTLEAFHAFAYSQFPSLRIAGKALAAPGEKITVQLTHQGVDVAKAGVRIFAKTSAGYLAKTEAFTDVNGQASFVAIPLGLELGDKMTPEFGFKWVTNLARTDVAA
jgi:hypothetical protein